MHCTNLYTHIRAIKKNSLMAGKNRPEQYDYYKGMELES